VFLLCRGLFYPDSTLRRRIPRLAAMSIELLRKRLAADRASFIEPCLPSAADKPPSGAAWIHEIKHDGFRLMARRDPVGIRLITRGGHDAARYPLVVEAVNHLKMRSCLIDGEVVCCDERGLSTFQLLRHRRNEPRAFLYAFGLLELNGADLRKEPIEVRKATLASILRKARHGVRLNEHLAHPDGITVFQHACKVGLEGIVSKRLGSRYRSGRSPDWLKFKNPDAPAVRREAEEDWGAVMAMRALVSADRPVVRIWHPDDPKQYVELQFESQEAANDAVDHLNRALKGAAGMEFGEDE
jgi:bifunctional non-homologous end joining protein LigD